MAQVTTTRETKGLGSRRKDAIIAAIASVLAAVILAAGGIIAAGRNDRAQLRDELTRQDRELTAAKREIAEWRAQAAAKDLEISRLRDLLRTSTREQPAANLSNTPQTDEINGNRPPAQAALATKSEDGFTFALYGCTRSGGSVACQMTVTNTGSDRQIELWADAVYAVTTKAIDDHGKEHRARRAELGGNEGGSPGVMLPSSVTVDASFTFLEVPENVRGFQVINVIYETQRYLLIRFRDVPIAA